MEFALTLEQGMLSESATRLLSEHCSVERIADPATKNHLWQQVVELGWVAMAIPEEQGGIGSRQEDMAVLFKALGRGLFRQPLLAASILASRILQRACKETAESLLQSIAAGELTISCALYEPAGRYSLHSPQTVARRDEGGYLISGCKSMVADGDSVDHILLSARLAGEDSYGIFLVKLAEAQGIRRERHLHIDDEPSADYRLEDLHVPGESLVIGPCADLDFLEVAMDDLRVLRCAELTGAMERSIELTVNYLKLRKQFGTQVANFQSIQHQIAELFIQSNQACSSVFAAIAGREGSAPAYHLSVSGCVMNVSRLAKQVIGQTIHLHGGIGFTTEHEVGHHFRKAVAEEKRLGDYTYHLQRLTELIRSGYETGGDKVQRQCDGASALTLISAGLVDSGNLGLKLKSN